MSSKPIPYDTPKALYDTALEVLRLAPWEFMEEDENFAVRPEPEGETFYVSVTGSAGISRSLIFYRGARGWNTFERMRAEELPPDEAIHVLDTMNLDFEPWSHVDADSRKRLKRVGLGPDQPFLPVPILYRPGRAPAIPDVAEMESFTRLVKAALPVLRRSEEEPAWLLEGPAPGFIFHVRPGGEDDHPAGEWLPHPEAPEEEISTAPPDQFAMARIKNQPLRPCGPWEVHVGDSGAAVAEGEGAIFPLVGLFADARTGFVAGFALAPSHEMPSSLSRELLKAMDTHQAKPEAFHVQRDDIAVWLSAVSESFGIPIVRKESLPHAEEARQALRGALKAGGKGKAAKPRYQRKPKR
jgi:hypothetical protein